jgi:hypothetical protein
MAGKLLRDVNGRILIIRRFFARQIFIRLPAGRSLEADPEPKMSHTEGTEDTEGGFSIFLERGQSREISENSVGGQQISGGLLCGHGWKPAPRGREAWRACRRGTTGADWWERGRDGSAAGCHPRFGERCGPSDGLRSAGSDRHGLPDARSLEPSTHAVIKVSCILSQALVACWIRYKTRPHNGIRCGALSYPEIAGVGEWLRFQPGERLRAMASWMAAAT